MIDEPTEQVEEEAPQEAPVEAPQEPSEPTATDEQREEASKYGWRPKERFERPPENWVDADRFLELPQTEVKRLRDEAKARDASYKEQLARVERVSSQAQERALEIERQNHQRQVAEITARQRAAVESADVKAYEQLEQQRQNMVAPQQPQAPRGPDPVVATYKQENSWTNDPVLWQVAHDAVSANPAIMKMPAAQQLEYGAAQARALFPDKFTPPKTRATKVDGGGLAAAAPSRANTLPADAARIGKGYVEKGIFKNMEEYAEAYFEDES